jgi:short-subunit dehydrogenase
VVIITGASRGIGRELAHQLATQGAWLVLAARDLERLEGVRSECEVLGGRALAIQTDVREQTQCAQMVQRTIEAYQHIDVLINNAGITMWGYFADITDPTLFENIMRTNYMGSVFCTYYALPFLKQTRGQIVGISSLTGKTGVPTRSGYAASKHAMVGFFDSLRIEIASSGVGVTMIHPGFVSSKVRNQAMGPDGRPLGKSPVREAEVMTVEECARQVIGAMTHRKRELVMTFRGKLGQWLKLIAPGLVDRIAMEAINTGR